MAAKDVGSSREESTGRRYKQTAGILRPPKNGVLRMTWSMAGFRAGASRQNFSSCLRISCSAILEERQHRWRRVGSAVRSRGVCVEKAQAWKTTLRKVVRKLER